MAQRRLVGIKELSEYLDTPVGTIYAWTHQKKIPYYKVGRKVKFELEKIDNWLKKKEVKPMAHWWKD